MLCPNQNPFIPESIKHNFHQPSSSLTPMEYFKIHELIKQEEANYEHSNDEVVEFDDESNSKIEIELETDPMAQGLISAYPYWLDR